MEKTRSLVGGGSASADLIFKSNISRDTSGGTKRPRENSDAGQGMRDVLRPRSLASKKIKSTPSESRAQEAESTTGMLPQGVLEGRFFPEINGGKEMSLGDFGKNIEALGRCADQIENGVAMQSQNSLIEMESKMAMSRIHDSEKLIDALVQQNNKAAEAIKDLV